MDDWVPELYSGSFSNKLRKNRQKCLRRIGFNSPGGHIDGSLSDPNEGGYSIWSIRAVGSLGSDDRDWYFHHCDICHPNIWGGGNSQGVSLGYLKNHEIVVMLSSVYSNNYKVQMCLKKFQVKKVPTTASLNVKILEFFKIEQFRPLSKIQTSNQDCFIRQYKCQIIIPVLKKFSAISQVS